ncbi:MAG TPA: hypothetical protein VMU90_04250 [Solirubrobacteraceae bacterium]|nr:hypothetical protein [Solirubrobacteraceae bacterium]HVA10098.1 hypothetical protein [Acidimicrobiales bacterium]
MRRIIIIGTALAVLGVSAAAYAASNFNNYSGSKLAISKGSKLGMVEKLKAGAPTGDRAAPLINIKVKIAKVKLDAGKLPVCTDAKIESNKTSPTGGCPKGSLIGTGTTTALLGPSSDPSASKGTPCSPHINVFSGGPKTQVFYFWTKSATDCGGLTTGATAPYDGHISYSGGNAIINVPLPPDISTKVANQPGLYGSLVAQTINYAKSASGKSYMVNNGCKGKRAWSITFTATKYGGGNETQTVKGTSPC